MLHDAKEKVIRFGVSSPTLLGVTGNLQGAKKVLAPLCINISYFVFSHRFLQFSIFLPQSKLENLSIWFDRSSFAGKNEISDQKMLIFDAEKKLLQTLQKPTKCHHTETNDPSNWSSGQANVSSGL